MGRRGRDRAVVRYQLPVQAAPITIEVVSLNPVHCEVYSIQHYAINFSVTSDRSVIFSEYSTNKTYRDNIPKILLKAAFNTINQTKSNRYLADIFGILLKI